MREQSVDKVIESMKNERGILGVDFTGIENLNTNSDREVNCKVYEDFGTFMPQLMYEVVLTEAEIDTVLSSFDELWSATDLSFGTGRYFAPVRYYAANEPNSIKWVNPKKI